MTTAEMQCKAAFVLWLLDQGCDALARAELHAMTDEPRAQSVPAMPREKKTNVQIPQPS